MLCLFRYFTADDMQSCGEFEDMFVKAYEKLDIELKQKKRSPSQLVDEFRHEVQGAGHYFLVARGRTGLPLGMLSFKYLDQAKEKLYISAMVVAYRFWDHSIGTKMLQTLWLQHPKCWLYGLMRKYNTTWDIFCRNFGVAQWEDTADCRWPTQTAAVRDEYNGFQIEPCCVVVPAGSMNGRDVK